MAISQEKGNLVCPNYGWFAHEKMRFANEKGSFVCPNYGWFTIEQLRFPHEKIVLFVKIMVDLSMKR